jgi:hypothetical protein
MDLGVAVGTAAAFEEDLDAVLLGDPVGAYARMDRTSKVDYQNRVRMWAKRSHRPPLDVAKAAIDLANSANQRYGAEDRRAHVGYFLTDSGITELAQSLSAKLELHERIRLHFLSNLFAYCTTIFLVCAAYGVLSVWLLGIELPWPGKALLALATALYISRIIPGWASLLVSRLLAPRWMPRIDFSAGIPESVRTLVAVPCLLTSREGIHRLVQTLERLRENNASANAHYALLSDFVDAPVEHAVDDEALLEEVCAQISILNERHGGGFMVLHRPRRWNPAEDCWMGWERKRGKLEDLNGYIVGGTSPFQTMHGDTATLRSTKYVVTLDDDNAGQTPGAIHKLAGALAHPLNRPVLGEDGRRVEAGHVLLQPRVMVSLPREFSPSRLEVLFNEMLEIETSEDYRSDDLPIVDVDQDVFGQSTYFGKGIYDVALFHQLTHGMIAENTVLSHDALEGGLVRAGIVTDVLLHETFVPTFHNSMTRTHRWQRGDWQLIPWLFPTIRNAAGVRVRNPLSSFGRWIIVHNVMRILFPTVALVCFLAGWATSRTPGLWTLNLLAVAWIPAIIGLLVGSIRTVLTGRFRTLLRGLWASLSMRSAQFIFAVDNAQNSFDAAARASYRMLVSHRKLLEWTASIIESARRDPTLPQYIRIMWFSPAFALGTVIFIGWVNPIALSSAIPFAILWASAPLVAWWWSQKPQEEPYTAQPSEL